MIKLSDKMPLKTGKKTVTRTFRIPIEWDEVLEYDANKNNISVSTLLNRILKYYIIYQRYATNNPSVLLSEKNLKNIINEMTDEQIITVARKSGRVITEESFLIRGLEKNYDNFKWFIKEIFDKSGRWFSSNIYTQNDKVVFHLIHKYLRKWSLFLKIYFEECINKMFKYKIEAEITENSIKFEIPKNFFNEIK